MESDKREYHKRGYHISSRRLIIIQNVFYRDA